MDPDSTVYRRSHNGGQTTSKIRLYNNDNDYILFVLVFF